MLQICSYNEVTSPKNGNFVPHVVPNLFLSFVEHKRRYFEE